MYEFTRGYTYEPNSADVRVAYAEAAALLPIGDMPPAVLSISVMPLNDGEWSVTVTVTPGTNS